MAANRQSTRSRRAKRLVGTLAVAAALLGAAGSASVSGATHTAADAAGASAGSELATFAVDSPAMVQAELIAVKYWNASPCAGTVGVSWAPLDPSINAASNWWNPIAAYGNAGANSQCRITLNQNQAFDWPMFCTVMVHEIGHLVGQQHSTDESSVMYPVYVAPIAECKGAAPGSAAAPAAAPVAAQAAAAASSAAGTGQTAHNRHKKAHKSHKKATKKHA